MTDQELLEFLARVMGEKIRENALEGLMWYRPPVPVQIEGSYAGITLAAVFEKVGELSDLKQEYFTDLLTTKTEEWDWFEDGGGKAYFAPSGHLGRHVLAPRQAQKIAKQNARFS